MVESEDHSSIEQEDRRERPDPTLSSSSPLGVVPVNPSRGWWWWWACPRTIPNMNNTMPTRLFEHCLVVGRKFCARTLSTNSERRASISTAAGATPSIIFHYSASASGHEDIKAFRDLELFCYPDVDYVCPTSAMPSENFTFVLTQMDGSRMLGFCRRFLPTGRGPRHPEVLCILSRFPWFSLFSRVLEVIERECSQSPSAMTAALKSLAEQDVPPPGEYFCMKVQGNVEDSELRLQRPDDDSYAFCDVCFNHIFSALSISNILTCFSALLCERRILMTCSNMTTLSSCIHAASALTYPFRWQHIFIPVLPRKMIHYVCAPMPFIIGVHASLMPEIKSLPMSEVMIIDLDRNEIKGRELAVELPSSQAKTLQKSLERLLALTTRYQSELENSDVADTFLAFFLTIFASYRHFMVFSDSGARFDKDAFIESQDRRVQRFMNVFGQSQMFEMWVCVREEFAEAGYPSRGTFEAEVNHLMENADAHRSRDSIVKRFFKDTSILSLFSSRADDMKKSRSTSDLASSPQRGGEEDTTGFVVRNLDTGKFVLYPQIDNQYPELKKEQQQSSPSGDSTLGRLSHLLNPFRDRDKKKDRELQSAPVTPQLSNVDLRTAKVVTTATTHHHQRNVSSPPTLVPIPTPSVSTTSSRHTTIATHAENVSGSPPSLLRLSFEDRQSILHRAGELVDKLSPHGGHEAADPDVPHDLLDLLSAPLPNRRSSSPPAFPQHLPAPRTPSPHPDLLSALETPPPSPPSPPPQ